jgi:hypothetical protein
VEKNFSREKACEKWRKLYGGYSDYHCADAVGSGFGDEAVQEGCRREGEDGFPVDASAGGQGSGPSR